MEVPAKSVPLATEVFTSRTSALPAQEQEWRARAEAQIAALHQQLDAAQAQARADHVRFQAFLDALPDGVLLTTGDGKIVAANQRCRDWFGPAAAAEAGGLLPGADGPAVLQYHFQRPADFLAQTRALGAAGRPCLGEPWALAAGGTLERDYLVLGDGSLGHAMRFRAPAPVAPERAATAAALHRAEAALAEQREFYETVLNELPVEVAVFDAAHRYRYVNAGAVADPALRAWLVGRDDFDYCARRNRPPALAERRRHCFTQAVATQAPVTYEETLPAPGGPRQVERHYRPLFAPDGALRMVIGTSVDVTRHQRAEKQLADQRTFYEFALDQLPCDVAIFDHEFRYLFVNAGGVRDPAVRAWMVGRTNYDYFARFNHPVAMADTRHARLEEAVRERRLITFEETFVRPDGTRHQYRCLQPVFHPDGALHLVVGYGLDVTERVATEQQLRHAKLAAESAVRAREIFLANMSHEIRTPMNAILGMGQLMAKTPLTPEQGSYRQAITTSAENLLVIINDILDLSKLEAGKMALERVGFAPAALLAQVEQTLHYKATEKGLSLLVQTGPGVPAVVLGDPYRVTQVLLNLAGNAIKFTEKGHVAVSCSVVAGAGPPDGTVDVLFRVVDTGIGIEPSFLAHIFQEFSQEDTSVTRKFGGTGLGLPICRNLVKLMGGDVALTSEKHRGTATEFTLRLPVGATQDLLPRALLPEDSPIRQDLRHKRVLLVEDNRFNRQIAKTFLQQAHVQVTEAEHGAAAVALAQGQAFDLILMDIQMPVMDGYAATTALRQQLGITTPIVALTANAIHGEREKCLAAGMNGYLAKPFQEAELLTVVSEWALRPRPRPAPDAASDPAPDAVVDAVVDAAVDDPAPLYRLDDLLKVGQGDRDFVAFMLATFVESGEEALVELAQGLREGHVGRLKSAAHTLKPSLAHLHAGHMLPAVERLDQWADGFQVDELAPLVAGIAQQLRAVMAEISLFLATQPPIALD
ncbi:MAG: response regulator [Janthinobacterium lividum]